VILMGVPFSAVLPKPNLGIPKVTNDENIMFAAVRWCQGKSLS
jgi:hypothetical protein